MTAPRIRVAAVRLRDLVAFASDAAAQVSSERDILPISRQRAFAWSRNPCADADDEVLHVAYHDGRCVGYRGAIPGQLRVDGVLHKVFWTSTHFVEPEYRRHQVALLLNRAAVAAAIDSVAVGLSGGAETFLRLLGWRAVGPAVLADLVLDDRRIATVPLRAAARLARRLRLGHLVSAFDIANEWLNRRTRPLEKALSYQILSLSTRQLRSGLRWRTVSHYSPADAVETFVVRPDPGFYRGLDMINWMIQHPWIVERGKQPDDSRNYHFSNVRDQFRFIPLVIQRGDAPETVGFAVFSVSTRDSRTTLKLLDFGPGSADTVHAIAGIAVELAQNCSADNVELPPSVADVLRDRPWSRGRIRSRTLPCYRWSSNPKSPLAVVAHTIAAGHCDGDAPFT